MLILVWTTPVSPSSPGAMRRGLGCATVPERSVAGRRARGRVFEGSAEGGPPRRCGLRRARGAVRAPRRRSPSRRPLASASTSASSACGAARARGQSPTEQARRRTTVTVCTVPSFVFSRLVLRRTLDRGYKTLNNPKKLVKPSNDTYKREP